MWHRCTSHLKKRQQYKGYNINHWYWHVPGHVQGLPNDPMKPSDVTYCACLTT